MDWWRSSPDAPKHWVGEVPAREGGVYEGHHVACPVNKCSELPHCAGYKPTQYKFIYKVGG